MVKYNSQNMYKIEKMPSLTKFAAFRDQIFKNLISAQLNIKESF